MTARRLTALLAVLGALLTGTALGSTQALADTGATTAAQSRVGQQTAAMESAVERFSSCLASARSGQVLLLIDESGSLAATDPRAARVTAARYLLGRLSELADRSGIRLDTGVAGFADRFTPPPRWRPLGPASLPDFDAQLDAFANRHSGRATDYWTALDRSRRALVAHGPAGTAQRCQALFWFSDGRLDLVPGGGATDPITHAALSSPADADAAEARERNALCRPDGRALVDQLRAAGVITFGIGLDANRRPGDFDLMRSIATGRSGCGRPSARTPGDFRLARGIDDLVFGFDTLIPPEPLNGPTRPVCKGSPCAAGRHAFVLDPSVSRVQILGNVDRAGPDAVLVPPRGAPITLRPRTAQGGTARRGPAGVKFTWLTERTVSVEMTPSSRGPGWSGEWALVFVDRRGGGQSRANIHITSDLQPKWLNQPGILRTGEVLRDARFGLIDAHGTPIDPGTVRGSVILDGALTPAGRPAQQVLVGLDKSRLGAPATLDLSHVPPGPARLQLTLSQTTAPATRPDGTRVPGTALRPRTVSLPLRIAGPAGYPQPAASVDFGTGQSVTELHGKLGVTGPGCLWVPEQQPGLDSAPPDTGRITVAGSSARDAGSCLRLRAGQHRDLDLVLRTDRPGNGLLSGTVTTRVVPLDDARAVRTIPVTATANLLLPLNQPLFVGLFVLVLLLGLAIPLALLWLFKFLTGKLPPGQVKAVREPVVVRDGALMHPDGRPFALVDDRFRNAAAPEPGRRRMLVLGVELRVAGWASPFGEAYVRPGVPGSGLRAIAPGLRRGRARLPLAVHNTWFALHDPAGPPQQAEVVVLLGLVPPAPAGALERIDEQLRRDLPRLLGELRGSAGPPGGPGGPGGPGRPPPDPGPPQHPFGPPGGNGGAPARSPFDWGSAR